MKMAPKTPYNVFFFQAEDGIRDLYVTGVLTCALPISRVADRAAAQSIGPGLRATAPVLTRADSPELPRPRAPSPGERLPPAFPDPIAGSALRCNAGFLHSISVCGAAAPQRFRASGHLRWARGRRSPKSAERARARRETPPPAIRDCRPQSSCGRLRFPACSILR